MKSIILTIDPQVLGSIERNLHNKYTYLQVQQVNQNIKAKIPSLKMVKIGNGVIKYGIFFLASIRVTASLPTTYLNSGFHLK
jgi:hypothetical protein